MSRALRKSRISFRKVTARVQVKYNFSRNIHGTTTDLGKWVLVVLRIFCEKLYFTRAHVAGGHTAIGGGRSGLTGPSPLKCGAVWRAIGQPGCSLWVATVWGRGMHRQTWSLHSELQPDGMQSTVHHSS